MRTWMDWASVLVAEVAQDWRREGRSPLALPIEVFGFDTQGRFFAEPTLTLNISDTGCSFKLTRESEPNAVVAIKLLANGSQPPPDRGLLFQVVWVRREDGGWVYGAAQLQKETPWGDLHPDGPGQSSVAQ